MKLPAPILNFLRWLFRAEKVEADIRQKHKAQLEARKDRMFKFTQKRYGGRGE